MDDRTLLERIIFYCEKIEKSMEYYEKDEVELKDNEYFQDTSSFYITQIGESVKPLSDEIKSEYPEIRWRGIVNMRNVLAHNYGGMDVDVWWKTITVHVPMLKATCENILADLSK